MANRLDGKYLREKRDGFENIYSAHSRALIRLALENKGPVSSYADFPSGEVEETFQKLLADRIIDVGIAEGHLITCADGLSIDYFGLSDDIRVCKLI